MFEALAAIKGTISPQAHARVDEKHFEIVGPTFSNTVGESEAVSIFGMLTELFVYKRSLVITEAVCCHKNPSTSCMQISLNQTLLRMCPRLGGGGGGDA